MADRRWSAVFFGKPATVNSLMLMYGKEASNRKQEIDRQHHTIPNQRSQKPKDKHYGNVHNRLWNPYSFTHFLPIICSL